MLWKKRNSRDVWISIFRNAYTCYFGRCCTSESVFTTACIRILEKEKWAQLTRSQESISETGDSLAKYDLRYATASVSRLWNHLVISSQDPLFIYLRIIFIYYILLYTVLFRIKSERHIYDSLTRYLQLLIITVHDQCPYWFVQTIKSNVLVRIPYGSFILGIRD